MVINFQDYLINEGERKGGRRDTYCHLEVLLPLIFQQRDRMSADTICLVQRRIPFHFVDQPQDELNLFGCCCGGGCYCPDGPLWPLGQVQLDNVQSGRKLWETIIKSSWLWRCSLFYSAMPQQGMWTFECWRSCGHVCALEFANINAPFDILMADDLSLICKKQKWSFYRSNFMSLRYGKQSLGKWLDQQLRVSSHHLWKLLRNDSRDDT